MVPNIGAQVRFDVFLGYDPIVPELAWFPMTFEIKNDGPGFTATIQVDEGRFGVKDVRSTIVELPTGTLKRLSIPVFASHAYGREWTARLLDERGNARAESTVPARGRVSWRFGIAGSLSRASSRGPVLPQIPINSYDNPPAVARWVSDLFPDNPLVLEGMSSLYLNSERALALKAGQVSALTAWLHAGGHLIVAVEQPGDLSGAPWLRRLLPLQPTSSKTTRAGSALHAYMTNGWPDLTKRLRRLAQSEIFIPPQDIPEDPSFSSDSFTTWTVTSAPESKTVLDGDSGPLIVSINRGWGRVTFLNFNPEREPFASWKHREWFWARLLGVQRNLMQERSGYTGNASDAAFGALLDSRQVHKIPIGWLLLLLIVYLATIGPFDYFWLKRINRPMLTWITFPCFVIIFSGLIYLLGYRLRSGESEWNELTVLDIIPFGTGSQTKALAFGSAYSPQNTRQPFGGGAPFSAFRGEAYQHQGSDFQRGFIEHVGNTDIGRMPIPVWTSRLFVQDSWLTNDLSLAVNLLQGQEGNKRLEIQNDLGDPIANASFVLGDIVYRIRSIPTGKSVHRLQDLRGDSRTDWLRDSLNELEVAVQHRSRTFGVRDEAMTEIEPVNLVGALSLGMDVRFNASRNAGPNFDGTPNPFAISSGFDRSDMLNEGNGMFFALLPEGDWAPKLAEFPVTRSTRKHLVRMLVPHTPKP